MQKQKTLQEVKSEIAKLEEEKASMELKQLQNQSRKIENFQMKKKEKREIIGSFKED